MNERSKCIFISAADPSGDLHAGRLIDALRRRLPNARIVGIGGKKMAEGGCEPALDPAIDLTVGASMLGGPLLRLGHYWRIVRRLQRAIAKIRPDVHVPIDSPALNWHLAAAAKKSGAKVVHYIAPQVWAWAPWRVKKLIRFSDHVACILPFEQDWLRRRGVNATFVGHPLFDDFPPRVDPPPDILTAFATGQWRVALLGGSRPVEIRNHTPALGSVARAIRERYPQASCTFAAGNERTAESIRKALSPDDLKCVDIVTGQTEQILERSHLAVAVSGTITLEAAYFGVPMVVFYRVGRVFSQLIRPLIRTPHFSLVNILAERKIVPELMPWYGKTAELKDMVLEVLDDPGYLLESREALVKVVEPLRTEPPRTASANAADLIVQVLDSKSRGD
jgi:lipid-A-disaccharide synthase